MNDFNEKTKAGAEAWMGEDALVCVTADECWDKCLEEKT